MLPYCSVQEAEAAVGGRSLTPTEALWFRYTAAVPDSRLYSLNLLFLFIIFHVGSFPTLLLDLLARTSLAPSLRGFKLQPSSFIAPADLLRSYTTVMLTFLIFGGFLVVFSNPIFKHVGIRTSLPLPSVWEILVQFTVYMVVEDYINYWCHRFLHTEWGYNNIHYKHHEIRTPTSICAAYSHWLEFLLVTTPSFVGPTIVPCHIVTVWLWLAFRQILSLDFHSGFDFWWAPTKLIPFFITPEHHDHHHFVGGKGSSNFGSIFTYNDYIYGTDKGYRYKKIIEGSKKEY